MSNSLHHLENIQETFKSMERLVKPNGYLLFNEMMKDNLNPKQISHKLIHHFSAKIDRESGNFHGETYKRDEIIEIIKKQSSFLIEDYWDMITPKEEMNKEQIKDFSNTVDKILGRATTNLQRKYKDEAKRVKDYILNNGLEACTQLVVISRKTQ